MPRRSRAPTAPAAAPAPGVDARRRTPAPAQPPAKACQKDEDCPEREHLPGATSARRSSCRRTSSRSTTARGRSRRSCCSTGRARGTPGYTVVFPFYWHFYSPTSDSFAVAPFYWHFTDSARQSELTVILAGLLEPRAGRALVRDLAAVLRVEQVRLGGAVLLHVQRRRSRRSATSSARCLVPLLVEARRRPGAFDLGFPLFVSSRDAAHAFTWAAAAELLLAQRRRHEPAGAAALLPERAQDRQRRLHLARLQPPRGPRAERLGALALLVRQRRRRPRRATTSCFRCCGASAARTSQRTVFFPLVWSFSTAEVEHDGRGPRSSASTAAAARTSTSLFPLWWSGGDDATGRGFKALLPLFFWQQRRQGAAPRRW